MKRKRDPVDVLRDVNQLIHDEEIAGYFPHKLLVEVDDLVGGYEPSTDTEPAPLCGDAGCERCPRIARGETCSPECPGWYLNVCGTFRVCDVCGLFDESDGVAFDAAISFEHMTPLRHEPNGECDGHHCWAVFVTGRGYEICRNDTCDVFDSDDAAMADAVPFIRAELAKRGKVLRIVL